MSATDSPLPPSTPSGPSAISLALAKQTNLAASDSSTEEEAVEDPQTPTTGIDGKLKVIAVEESARGDEEGEAQDSGINAWMGLLASAVDHPDQHVVKVSPQSSLLNPSAIVSPSSVSTRSIADQTANDRSFER